MVAVDPELGQCNVVWMAEVPATTTERRIPRLEQAGLSLAAQGPDWEPEQQEFPGPHGGEALRVLS